MILGGWLIRLQSMPMTSRNTLEKVMHNGRWQTWCMHRTENPTKGIRFPPSQQQMATWSSGLGGGLQNRPDWFNSNSRLKENNSGVYQLVRLSS